VRLFAFALYAITVMSLPMLCDKDVDFITAIIVSLGTIRSNKTVMIGWAAIIAVSTFLAMLTRVPRPVCRAASAGPYDLASLCARGRWNSHGTRSCGTRGLAANVEHGRSQASAETRYQNHHRWPPQGADRSGGQPPVWRASTHLYENVAALKRVTRPMRMAASFMVEGGAPTQWSLAEALTELEPGAHGTMLYPSGVAAIAGALLSVLQPGDVLLMSDNAYDPAAVLRRVS
jgi:hypothetical protein